MRYQTIESKIWHDEKFTKLTPLQQRLFLYLLTCPHGNFLGIFTLNPFYVCGDLNYNLQDYLLDLERIGFIKYDCNTNVIWIVNLLKYFNRSGHWNGKHKKGAVKILKELPKSYLIQEFIEYYHELFNGVSIGVSIGVSSGVGEGYARSEEEEEEEEVLMSDVQFFLNEPLKLSNLLFEEILKNNNGSRIKNLSTTEKKKTINRWAKDVDLLLRKDKQEPSKVEEVIKFATGDSFWGANILSGSKLREKWDTLTAQMQRKLKRGEVDDGRFIIQAGH